MTTRTRPVIPSVVKSMTAVVAGLLFAGIIVGAADHFLAGPAPAESGTLLISLAVLVGASLLGSYLTARLSPKHPLRHALFLGVIGLGICAAAAFSSGGSRPVWYHVAALAAVLPCAALGGLIEQRQRGGR